MSAPETVCRLSEGMRRESLPSGIVHGVTDMMHGDASGLERAGAITAGPVLDRGGLRGRLSAESEEESQPTGDAARSDPVNHHPR